MKIRRILSVPAALILCAGLLGFLLIFAFVTRTEAPEVSVSHIAATGQVRLAWEPVSGARAYRIYRADEGEGSYKRIHTTKLPGFTDETAESGCRYTYYVRAVSGLFFPSSPGTEVVSFPVLPQPVIRLSGVDATGHTRIVWDAIDGAAHYRLQRSEDGSSWDLLDTTGSTGCTDDEAQTGVEYFYRVQAVAPDAAFSSAFSDVHSRICALPSPEVSLRTDSETGAPVLRWEPVEEARGYEVFRAEGSSDHYSSIALVRNPLYADLDSEPAGRYRYKVTALSYEADADSAGSAEVSCIRNLAQPQVVLGCEAATGNVTLTWESVPGAAGYEIYWSSREDGEYELLNTTEKESYVDSAGTLGESYFYRVLAASETTEANSAPSAAQKGTFSLPCPVVTGGNDPITGSVELHWEAVEDAIRYEIYRAEESGGKPKYLGSTKAENYSDKSGTRLTRYFYSVVAVSSDPDASSAPSQELEKAYALPAPSISISNHSTNGRVKISWKAVEGAVGYEVYRASSKDGDYRFLTDSDNTVALDTLGSAETTYHYKVMALAEDEAANSGLSSSRSGTYYYPSKLTLTAEINGSGKPRLEWNEVENGVKYRLYRSLLPDSDFMQIASFNGVEYTNSDVLEGVSYYYRVRAVDKNGEILKASNTISILCPLSKKESFKTRYVNAPKAWLYAAPTIDAQTTPVRYMDKIKLGEDVKSNSQSTWYRVYFEDQLYYMRIEKDSDVLTSKKRKFKYEGETKRQQQIIDLALEISEEWKTTYAHDQSNGIPNSRGVYGFDCTGLVKYILGTVMQKTVPAYRLYASIETLYETESIYNAGYPGEFFATDVKRKNLQPGDVLFFTSQADGSDSDEIGHCGIYLGNNEFIHATSAWEDAVCIVPLTGSFKENLVAIRRYIPKTVTPANTEVKLKKNGTHYLYTERTRKSSVVTAVSSGGTVTVLFTDNADWAWVRAENGKEGFIRIEAFQ